MIYFITCAAADAVKIGNTTQSYRKTPFSAAIARMGQAQVGCPFELTLRAVCLGGEDEERSLHQRFASLRIRGEWFKNEGALADLLASLPQAPSLGRGWHFQLDHPARRPLLALPEFAT